jgi:hypothetical protein
LRLSRNSIRIVTLSFLSAFVSQLEISQAAEQITLVLECKGSMTEYRHGVFRWSSDAPVYYRIRLRSSDAAVEFRLDGEMFALANRFDMKSYKSSYELAAPYNTAKMSQNIEIDRLNGNFFGQDYCR